MRNRSPANRAASSPPVPARISRIALFSSSASLGSSRRRTWRSSSGSRPPARAAPARRDRASRGPAPAARARPARAWRSRKASMVSTTGPRSENSLASSRILARLAPRPAAPGARRAGPGSGRACRRTADFHLRPRAGPRARRGPPPPPAPLSRSRSRTTPRASSSLPSETAQRAPIRSARFIRCPGLPLKARSTAIPARRSSWASSKARCLGLRADRHDGHGPRVPAAVPPAAWPAARCRRPSRRLARRGRPSRASARRSARRP